MLKILLIVLMLAPAVPYVSAQATVDLNNLPEPVTDLWDTFNKIKFDIGENSFITRITRDATGIVLDPIGFVSKLKTWWGNINNWLESHIGVSLSEILRAVLNFLVFLIDIFARVLKLAVSQLN